MAGGAQGRHGSVGNAGGVVGRRSMRMIPHVEEAHLAKPSLGLAQGSGKRGVGGGG